MEGRRLVIGASGQIGTELVMELRSRHGAENVVASDIKNAADEVKESGPFEILDVLDRDALKQLIERHNVKEVYLLAALLSATAEHKVAPAWTLNMDGLFNVLELAREGFLDKIFWPSSIAVFGPNTPKENTPQFTITEPNTVYGISKLAGERWCEYYHAKYGVDVRSIRYPGLIGYKSAPGGGTTDYAVDIFHQAINSGSYTCFLSENQRLPMMYMEDAIDATLNLMDAPADSLTIRSSYNVSGIDFTPKELTEAIKTRVPEFNCNYKIDSREGIAASWPDSIDDSVAQNDWDWSAKYGMEELVDTMITNLAKTLDEV
ncbi:MAG: nucleoside-diphosphate-sugar epimerase [Granulosicoccus sp.]|jgi:nucleoside-diphosphate-sugar epimerase